MDAVVDAVAMIQSDYFDLFGISRKFDINIEELNRRYIELQMEYHPDITGNDADSAVVNCAYNTLLDPLKRAEYMLNVRDGDNRCSCPNEFFDIMEELAEADETHRYEIINNLRKMLDDTLCKISGLFAANAKADAIIVEVNRAKYIKKMLGR